MATCTRADGAFSPTEAALITAAAQVPGAPLVDPQALASIETDELRAA